MARPRAADDFAMIRARMEELRRKPLNPALQTILPGSERAWKNCAASAARPCWNERPFGNPSVDAPLQARENVWIIYCA